MTEIWVTNPLVPTIDTLWPLTPDKPPVNYFQLFGKKKRTIVEFRKYWKFESKVLDRQHLHKNKIAKLLLFVQTFSLCSFLKMQYSNNSSQSMKHHQTNNASTSNRKVTEIRNKNYCVPVVKTKISYYLIYSIQQTQSKIF